MWCAALLCVAAWQTCLILLGGFLFFPPAIPPPTSQLLKNVGGIVVALVGVVVYSQLKIAESSPTSQPDWCDAMLPASFLDWAETQFGTGAVDSRPAGQYTLVKMEEGTADITAKDGNTATAAVASNK